MGTQGWATPPPLPQSQGDMTNKTPLPHKAVNAAVSPDHVVKIPWCHSPMWQGHQALFPCQPHLVAQPAAPCMQGFRKRNPESTRHRLASSDTTLSVIRGKKYCFPGVTWGLAGGLAPLVCTDGTTHILPAESCTGTHFHEHPMPTMKGGQKLGEE